MGDRGPAGVVAQATTSRLSPTVHRQAGLVRIRHVGATAQSGRCASSRALGNADAEGVVMVRSISVADFEPIRAPRFKRPDPASAWGSVGARAERRPPGPSPAQPDPSSERLGRGMKLVATLVILAHVLTDVARPPTVWLGVTSGAARPFPTPRHQLRSHSCAFRFRSRGRRVDA